MRVGEPAAVLALVAGLLAPAGVAVAAPEAGEYRQYVAHQGRVVEAVDGFWVTALRGAGVEYRSPKVRVAARGSGRQSDCGRKLADPVDARGAYPAFYCRADRSVNLSSGWMYRVMFSRFHRGGVAAVVAHEFGHHVQRSIGIADPSVRRQELQADCLAGIWVRAAVRSGALESADVVDARRALRALGDTARAADVHHGTAKERSRWFNRGYRSGDAYSCNH